MSSQYLPLFLKYRPQAISELVGQQQIAVTLTNAIKYNRISHAYLFTGPRGTGKTSAARIFAKSLNCEKGSTAEPCLECTSCLEIKQGISPSVFEIDAASNNSVDDARLLIERAPLAACGGKFKLYIIDECHMLTKEAFNALLKTIEEPPANVVFILATTEEHKVLPTIVSRCQKLIFRLINEDAMLEHLSNVAVKENILIEQEALKSIVTRANGGLRDALSLLDQISLLGDGKDKISTDDVLLLTGALPEDTLNNICTHIFKKDWQQALPLLKDLLESGREAHLIASELAKYMLNIAKVAYSQKDNLMLKEIGKLVDQSDLIEMIEYMDKLEASCRRSNQPVMNLEIGILSLCHRLEVGRLKHFEARLQSIENSLGLDGANASENSSYSQPNEQNTQPVITNEAKPQESKPQESKPQESKPQESKLKDEIDLEEMDIAEDVVNDLGSNNGAAGDIDVAWQKILVELQKRHLPTFSLVSTHAFPVEITDNLLILGVFVDSFQKMIENKLEYIKVAAIACNFDKNLKISVKVQAGDQKPQQKKNQIISTIMPQESDNPSVTGNISQPNKPNMSLEVGKADSGMIKEAYRLFEGPGSRYIGPNP